VGGVAPQIQSFTFLDQLFTAIVRETCSYQRNRSTIYAESHGGLNMSHDWESAYRAAILETDASKLGAKIDSATSKIFASMLELDAAGEGGPERQRLVDALNTLDLIRRVELNLSA
jgi:hypothetical protein